MHEAEDVLPATALIDRMNPAQQECCDHALIASSGLCQEHKEKWRGAKHTLDFFVASLSK